MEVGCATPEGASSPVPPLHEKAPNFFPPLGCSSRSRAVGQTEPVSVSACFQPENGSSQAPIALKLPFHIHMPYFSQVASINGSSQTPVLKICGFQRNLSEAVCAGSDGCGARGSPGAPPGLPRHRRALPAGTALGRGHRRRSLRPPPPLHRALALGIGAPLPSSTGTPKLSRLSCSLISESPCRAL